MKPRKPAAKKPVRRRTPRTPTTTDRDPRMDLLRLPKLRVNYRESTAKKTQP